MQQDGAVSNRAGLEFVGEIKDSSQKARLIPFSFNTEQTYVIEAGNKYFRFIKDGGYIIYPDDYGLTYEGAYSLDEQAENLFTYKLGEQTVYTKAAIALDTICYEDKELTIEYGKVTSIEPDAGQLSIDKDDDKIAKRGQIVEIETPYTTDELSILKYAQNADVLTICHPNHPQIELSRYSQL